MKTQIIRTEHTNIHAQASKTHYAVKVISGGEIVEEYSDYTQGERITKREAQNKARQFQHIYNRPIKVESSCRGVQYQHEV